MRLTPIHKLTVFLVILLTLASCGGQGDSADANSSSYLNVQGAAVKGPLINASVSAYVLDTSSANLKGELIALGATNNLAQLELEIDSRHTGRGPFLLEFTNGNEIGGSLPEIETLTTILSNQQLLDGTPVYATPLSTFAIEYAAKIADRYYLGGDPVTEGLTGNGDNLLSIDEFNAALATASTLIRNTLGLGALDESIDLFATSPVISADTDVQKTLALRTANEVFAAIVTELKDELAGSAISGSSLVERLAEDFTDGQFDKASVEGAIAELNDIADIEAVFTQDPSQLPVPGGDGATIDDLAQMLVEEIDTLAIPVESESLVVTPIIIEAPQTSVVETVVEPEPVEPAPVVVNTPPSVSFALPAANAVYDYNQAVAVQLNTQDTEGSVAACRLYVDGSLIATDTAAPFSFAGGVLNVLAAGSHTLQAACDDNQSLTGSSPALSITINPAPQPEPQPEPEPEPEPEPQPAPESLPEPQPSVSSVILDWVTPTTRTDGSALAINAIDSYEIYYYLANNSGNGVSITVPATDSAGSLVTSYQIDNIVSGSYLFSIATVDTEGLVSEFVSPVAVILP